ncbi:MAG: exosortase-associated EpsI family protein [Planctomycetes bacterium]|nr:exosortase-associated EpsI family protein [Planctomycetota bacterium]
MDFIKQYSLVLGMSILIGVIALLFASSDLMFSSGATFIDTGLHSTSGDEVYIETKVDFGNQAYVAAFPLEFEEWSGYDEDTTEWAERLGADVALLRGYTAPGMYQPIFFLIMQAKTESSFHSPEICYPAQGYSIQEKADEAVLITDVSWTNDISSLSIPIEKLVVIKELDGGGTDRRVVLYFYVKGNQFTSDTITMIRMEASAPANGSYESILNQEKEFLAQAIPYMFGPGEEEEWNPIVLEMAGWGVGGYVIIVFLLCIPVAIFVYPMTRWGRDFSEKSGPGNNET